MNPARMNLTYSVVEEGTKLTEERRVRDSFVSVVGKRVTLLEGPQSTPLLPADNNTETELFEWWINKDGLF
jgi:hypothetical protein